MPFKNTIRSLLADGLLEHVAGMVLERRRVLGTLISLTYDSDRQIGWRAVEAMGLAAGRIVDTEPGVVREHLRRLYWLITEESGGICWKAPEAMAEVVANARGKYDEYIPIVLHLILEFVEEDLQHFRPACLWAIGRLGPLVEGYVPEVLHEVLTALDVNDPQARGMAVWCLTQLGRRDSLEARSDLLSDEGPVEIYEDRVLKHTTVARLVQGAIEET